MARLYICSDEDPVTATALQWVQIGDLDNYTYTADSTDTNVNTAGWIRTLPMERGLTLTATGRLNSQDEGQRLVNETALEIGCGALAYYRFLIPGPRDEDPPERDIGFWAWANMQDIAAASTDPFSWGAELRFWAQPDALDSGGQPIEAVLHLPGRDAHSETQSRQRAGGSRGARPPHQSPPAPSAPSTAAAAA
jgi:hypothetical protein